MSDEKKYIPKKGDIVWIDFDPSAGKEIQKRRPGLVVSRYEFNRKTMFAVIWLSSLICRKYVQLKQKWLFWPNMMN